MLSSLCDTTITRTRKVRHDSHVDILLDNHVRARRVRHDSHVDTLLDNHVHARKVRHDSHVDTLPDNHVRARRVRYADAAGNSVGMLSDRAPNMSNRQHSATPDSSTRMHLCAVKRIVRACT